MCVLPGNVGDQTTTNDQDGLLAVDTELVHRVNDAQEGVNGLGLLANHGLVDGKLELVVVEVLLDLVSVDIEDVGVHDSQDSAPTLVAVGELAVLGAEDTVKELEVIFDLLVARDVETSLGFLDGSVHVRHSCGVVCVLNKRRGEVEKRMRVDESGRRKVRRSKWPRKRGVFIYPRQPRDRQVSWSTALEARVHHVNNL